MKPTKLKLVLFGAGSIARTVAKAIADGKLHDDIEVVAVVGGSEPPSERTRTTAGIVEAPILPLQEALDLGPDWVLEAAGGAALRSAFEELCAHGSGLIVMSIGALLDPDLWDAVQRKRQAGGEVILPSGSIGGLDAVAALNALGELESVSITTSKAPAGLSGAPYLVEHDIRLSESDAQLVFEGTALEAVRAFPANVNVAAALSLAGIGGERTMVKVVSDPNLPRTRHAIRAEGSSGRLSVEIESAPNPLNPGSSYLSALSAIAQLKRLASGG